MTTVTRHDIDAIVTAAIQSGIIYSGPHGADVLSLENAHHLSSLLIAARDTIGALQHTPIPPLVGTQGDAPRPADSAAVSEALSRFATLAYDAPYFDDSTAANVLMDLADRYAA